MDTLVMTSPPKKTAADQARQRDEVDAWVRKALADPHGRSDHFFRSLAQPPQAENPPEPPAKKTRKAKPRRK